MDFGFSTLGCAELSFDAASQLVEEFGFDFIELRALGNSIDLPRYFRESRPNDPPSSAVRVLSTSFFLEDPDPREFELCLEYAALASQLRAPYIRVFAGKGEQEAGSPIIQAAAKCARLLRNEINRRGWQVEPILETHSGFSFSRPCVELNQQLERPIGLLWDSHHTWKIGGESLVATWEEIGSFVRHIHYKDSVADSSGKYHHVLPGHGEFPSANLLGLIRQQHFSGGVSLEWEKYWHPEIGPIREALVAFKAILPAA